MCPACSNTKGNKPFKAARSTGVEQCGACGAIFGQCYLGDSYAIVLPYLAMEEVPPEKLRYFDLDCLGSRGIERRHGWYDPETKLVHQIG